MIRPIPNSKNFIDLILSNTQRKTPTIVHKNYSIQRIREFYLKKIKFFHSSCEKKLNKILEDFPQINRIHLFYSDLIHILADRNQYKYSLGIISKIKQLIKKFSRDYIKMVKYANSIYVCKQLKKKMFGKVCTVLKKNDKSFIFLEKIRIVIKKLPSLNPTKQIIMLAGSRGTGKTSLLNKLTGSNIKIGSNRNEANSLIVSHFSNFFINWQILDSIGMEFYKIEKCNSFEIQTLNSYVHLNYFLFYLFDFNKENNSIHDSVKTFFYLHKFYKKKNCFLFFGKTDLEWDCKITERKKALVSLINKKSEKKYSFLKVSLHDEIGFLSLRQKLALFGQMSDLDNSQDIKEQTQRAVRHRRLKIVKSRNTEIFHRNSVEEENVKKSSYYYTNLNRQNLTDLGNEDNGFQKKKENFENEEKIREFKNESLYVSEFLKTETNQKYSKNDFFLKNTIFNIKDFY